MIILRGIRLNKQVLNARLEVKGTSEFLEVSLNIKPFVMVWEMV